MNAQRNPLARIAVFCGSNFGVEHDYRHAASRLGATLAAAGIEVVYGGTNMGTMGVLADGALDAGGRVIGVIPEHLVERGHRHPRLTEVRVVGDIRVRKRTMAELADAFICLPGGIGTMEELFEVWVENQFAERYKPIGLLDIRGYYAPLLAFVDRMVAEGFLPRSHRDAIAVDADPATLIDALRRVEPPSGKKWLTPSA